MKCPPKMSFQDCELAILRKAIDKVEAVKGSSLLNTPEIKQIIQIVEQFIRRKKRICYGGTAINNILPAEDQFYDKSIELPDYDFFSSNALNDAIELANIYYSKGFEEVEAKAGVHKGTYKVFVNFIPVADITQLVPELYSSIKKEAIRVNGILYTPPNYLRMSMYLELSRPLGDVSRWEKVLKRLTLLNKAYPLKGEECSDVDIQRVFTGKKEEERDIYYEARDSLINQGVVFFGAMANRIYMKHHPSFKHKKMEHIPDFDVLSEDPETTATILKERLQDIGIKKVKTEKLKGVGEVIAPHYQVSVGEDIIAFIYEPLECHSYNVIRIGDKKVKIATIDTMLSFYLAFLYASKYYYQANRIVCMCQYLFEVQQKNRLKQKGVLKRFSINCYGQQSTLATSRAEKTEKYKELKGNRNSKEYKEWFLRYVPKEKKMRKTKKTKTRKRTTKKSKNKTLKNRFLSLIGLK